MFIQIHMLQSVPPGNLNRDDMGQPKKCVFGGVTRGRISSQCLKRNIRLSPQFKEAFGDARASRTKYLPKLVGDELTRSPGLPEDEIADVMSALTKKFSKGEKKEKAEEPEEDGEEGESNSNEPGTGGGNGQTPQLVFFPQPFAAAIAEAVRKFREEDPAGYDYFLGRKKKVGKDEKKVIEKRITAFEASLASASQNLTVDIGLFGRMTTSDLVVNVEASCQVAHAISTHEALTESDYFTAMDDLKESFAANQSDKAGAAFLGSGETETFFNSAVYYKYYNIDLGALSKHLPNLTPQDAANVAGVFIKAAALATPTGKQNVFAAHSVPDLILVEVTKSKQPLSYANAFLRPVEGGTGRNLMTESANALLTYVSTVATAYYPTDVQRFVLAVGPAAVDFSKPHRNAATLDDLVESIVSAAGGS